MSEETHEERTVQKVKDPEGFSQQHIRKRILDMKKDVQDRRRELSDPTLPVTQAQKNRALFESVKSFVIELESLLKDEDIDKSEEYWQQKEIGTVVIKPPSEAQERFSEVISHTPPGATRPQAYAVEITGLQQFINLEPPFNGTWAVQSMQRSGVETDHYSETEEVSWTISENAFRACNDFIAGIGIKLEIEEEEERWKI